jgi:hypothetical protein
MVMPGISALVAAKFLIGAAMEYITAFKAYSLLIHE